MGVGYLGDVVVQLSIAFSVFADFGGKKKNARTFFGPREFVFVIVIARRAVTSKGENLYPWKEMNCRRMLSGECVVRPNEVCLASLIGRPTYGRTWHSSNDTRSYTLEESPQSLSSP